MRSHCLYGHLNVYICCSKNMRNEKKEFTGDIKRHNKIWETIADEIRTINIKYIVSGSQCQSKFNSLKNKKILDHNSVSGNDRKTWPYFEVSA